MFRLKINPTPAVVERLRVSGGPLIAAMMRRMNLLMFKLQSKIVGEKIPAMFPKGAPNIVASVRAIPAHAEGTRIRGEVEAGGPKTTKKTLGGPNAGVDVDYAALQETGVAHPWLIQPVYFSNAWALNQKTRVLSVQGLPKALSFLLNGKRFIVRSVMHPGLKERPYMREGLKDMQEQIVQEFSEEFSRFLA